VKRKQLSAEAMRTASPWKAGLLEQEIGAWPPTSETMQ
jgi:hypothetical protein